MANTKRLMANAALLRGSRSLSLVFLAIWAFLLPADAVAEYRLGPGDVVRISVHGQEDLRLETRIHDSNTIAFPLIGKVEIGGLTPSAAEDLIAERLRSGGFVRAPNVSLMVTEFAGHRISVLGHVNNPGKYPMRGSERALDMVALAGGISPQGADRFVVVHADNTQEVVDLVALFQGGDVAQNLMVQGGDMIYVPQAPTFYVYGEVRRPGSYRLEREMTMIQALSVGGGLTPRGTDSRLDVKRRDQDGNVTTVRVELTDRVQSGDVIYVKESIF